MYRAYKSKYNNERENEVILLMVSEHINEIEKKNFFLHYKVNQYIIMENLVIVQ